MPCCGMRSLKPYWGPPKKSLLHADEETGVDAQGMAKK